MPAKRSRNPSEATTTPGGYGELLAGIKQRVSTARVRAHVAVSRELNLLYWQIGRDIVIRQERDGWGKAVIELLASDVQAAFPGIEGFSANNIWRMRAFYLAWEMRVEILAQTVTELNSKSSDRPTSAKLAQPAQEISPGSSEPFLAQPATELPPPEILSIPWFHNVILIQKIKDPATRLWYAGKTLENGWSRSILTLQIESEAHQRHGKATKKINRVISNHFCPWRSAWRSACHASHKIDPFFNPSVAGFSAPSHSLPPIFHWPQRRSARKLAEAFLHRLAITIETLVFARMLVAQITSVVLDKSAALSDGLILGIRRFGLN